MTDLPIERKEGASIEPIAVDADGNAYMDFTREKESIIRSERLDAQHPVVRVDLETILTQEGGCGVSIVIQDFGLPARTINVSGDFVTVSDVRGVVRSEEHYAGAPKHLYLSAISPDRDRTFSLDDRFLPVDWEPVGMSRGETMMFVHDSIPSDERTGYIECSGWELIALLPKDYYGANDFSDVSTHIGRGYVPFIGLNYEGSVLSIYSLDDVHAEVQYQQVRSLADEVSVVPEKLVDELDEEQLIAGLIAGNDEARATFMNLLKNYRETLSAVDLLQAELVEVREGNDSLETLLAGVKRKLHDARSEAARLDGEVRRLRQQAKTESRPGSQTNSDFLRDLLGGRHTTEKDPHGHCAKLGIEPAFLFSLSPEAASRVVKGIHRGLAVQFHSDKQEGERDDEPMKAVNIAVDSILSRLENGYWGRR